MEQIVFARLACGLDAGHNAAPGTRHLFVAAPGQAQGKFVGPLAAVDQMRVAIDQAGRDQGAVTVVERQLPIRAWQIGMSTHPGDGPLLNDDGRIRHRCSACAQSLRRQVQVVPNAMGAGP